MSDSNTEDTITIQNGILKTIKSSLGVGLDLGPFDTELIIHANTAFTTLTQLGVGPKEGFALETGNEVWSDYTEDKLTLGSVKTYIYAKVRLIFDPPATSFGIKALEDLCKEIEWRLNASEDTSE